jgi:nucleotide-binding universal stress UspA family protein
MGAEDSAMADKTLRPYRIVVALDDSDMAPVVLERALDEANRHGRAEMHLIRVVPGPGRVLRRGHEGQVDAAHEQAAQLLREKVDDFGAPEGLVAMVHARGGHAAEEIIALADDVQADVILIGRHGGLAEHPSRTGSVVREVLREARCPVLVVQPLAYDSEIGDGCAACAQVRHDSGGERWFCDAHHDERPWRSTFLMIQSASPTGGGLGSRA